MSMAHQFGQRLPRPVQVYLRPLRRPLQGYGVFGQVWVLDTLPGEASWMQTSQQDRPFDLIKTLQNMPLPILSRASLIRYLTSHGFSSSIANWMTTNLRQEGTGFTWAFDLEGIEELYRSYETTSLWPLLYTPPEGLEIDFVRAEHSHFQWTDQLADQIETLGQ